MFVCVCMLIRVPAFAQENGNSEPEDFPNGQTTSTEEASSDEPDDETPILSGRVAVDHPNFADHEFRNSYVFNLDKSEYIRLEADGSFRMEVPEPGDYSFKTYVPGFEPAYGTVRYPAQTEIIIKIDFQVVRLSQQTVEYGIPGSLYRLNESLSVDERSSDAPSERAAGAEEEKPRANFGEFFQSVRDIFSRDKNNEE